MWFVFPQLRPRRLISTGGVSRGGSRLSDARRPRPAPRMRDPRGALDNRHFGPHHLREPGRLEVPFFHDPVRLRQSRVGKVVCDALERWFGGRMDNATLALLEVSSRT